MGPRGMIVTWWNRSALPGVIAATNACPARDTPCSFFSSSKDQYDLRSFTPIITLSLDISKSTIITNFAGLVPRGHNAASFTRFARSAPENPECRARMNGQIHGSRRWALAGVAREDFFAGPFTSGRTTRRGGPKRPGRSSAGFQTVGRGSSRRSRSRFVDSRAIHFNEQRVQAILLAFVCPPAETCAAVPPNRIRFQS